MPSPTFVNEGHECEHDSSFCPENLPTQGEKIVDNNSLHLHLFARLLVLLLLSNFLPQFSSSFLSPIVSILICFFYLFLSFFSPWFLPLFFLQTHVNTRALYVVTITLTSFDLLYLVGLVGLASN